MAVTSGVRAITGSITVGGLSVPFEHASVTQMGARQSGTFSAVCALNQFPGGDRFFSSLSDNSVSIVVNGQTLFTGEVDKLDIHYDVSSVSFTGRDKSGQLHNIKSNEAFKNKTRTEIVQQIAEKAGLSASVGAAGGGGSQQAGKKLTDDYVKLTDGISLAAILHKMAELDGVRWSVIGDVLHYGLGLGGGGYTISYQPGNPARGNFIRLEVSTNCQAAKAITVKIKGWDTENKKVISSEKKYPASLSGAGSEMTYEYRADQTQQDHMDDLAKKKADETVGQEISVTAVVVGDASIDPTQQLQLQGTAFDQSLNIESVHHDINWSGGWVTTIRAKSAREGRSAE